MKIEKKHNYILEIAIIAVLFLVMSLGCAMRQPEIRDNLETAVRMAEKENSMLSFRESYKGE